LKLPFAALTLRGKGHFNSRTLIGRTNFQGPCDSNREGQSRMSTGSRAQDWRARNCSCLCWQSRQRACTACAGSL